MTVCSKFDNNTEKYDFTFRVELAVNEGEKRKFEYFEQSEIF